MNGSDRIATDLFGPFDTRQDVVDWIAESKLEYRPNGEAFDRAVLTWSEMSADESHEPWCTAIFHRA